jgi:hypothetical protein
MRVKDKGWRFSKLLKGLWKEVKVDEVNAGSRKEEYDLKVCFKNFVFAKIHIS